MTRAPILLLALLFAILTPACGSAGSSPFARVTIPDPDLAVSRTGPSGAIDVSVFRIHGYAGDVRLTVSDLPVGVTSTNPVVSNPATAAQITFRASGAAAIGDHRVMVTAEQDALDPITFAVDLHVMGRPGTLDATYYLDGTRATTVVEPGTGLELQVTAEGLEVQFDDKIVVVGTAGVSYPSPLSGRPLFIDGICLVRYLPDGALDPSFGMGGYVTTRLGAKTPHASRALDVIQSRTGDGSLIVVGHATPAGDVDQLVLRYDADGVLDPTFGTGGIVITDFGGEDNDALAVAEQSDGKLVVVGSARDSFTGIIMSVTRYNVDGSLDRTFGPGGTGYRHQALAGLASVATDVQILADGSILVVGGAEVGGDKNAVVLMKLDTTGDLDESFGSSGEVVLDHPVDTFGWAVLATGGAPIVAGSSVDQALLAFYGREGLLDTSLGTGGLSLDALPVGTVGLVDLVEHGDLVRAAGTVRTPMDTVSGPPTFDAQAVVIGYGERGLRDIFFGDVGWALVRYETGESATCVGIERQRDGRLVIAGTSGGTKIGVARLWP